MVAAVDIANQALGLCAARSVITSFNESNPESAQCNIWYDTDRLWLLRQNRWRFARRQDLLTLLATAPGVDTQPFTNTIWPFMPWAYCYAVPPECVKFNYIIPTSQMQPLSPQPMAVPQPPVPFEVSSYADVSGNLIKAIFTNQTQAVGVWTHDERNPDMFDSQFVEALSHLLGSHLAIPLSGNVAIANSLFSKAAQVISEAMAQDGNEGLRVQGHVPDWIRIRGYVADFQTPWWNAGWGPGWPGV